MTRREILQTDRKWIFDVLFWPRDEQGIPCFPSDGPKTQTEWLADLAGQHGLTGDVARAWAKRKAVFRGNRL